ncbi:MAG TPA: sigma-70 family RNA polymerase sigma factor [Candidatus Aminicenantes bacterium]|nr:sigma-70 family RNA polymerase sigma factor [Candidatus Aminicenantes bacterium]
MNRMRETKTAIDDPGPAPEDFWARLAPCRHGLHAFVRKALNYSEDADDVFQETVERACRYFHAYDPALAFRAWIYSIASNEVKRHYRRQRGAPGELPDERELGFAGAGLTAGELAQARELHRLVMELRPDWREVFLLRYQDGFNATEVAAITGRSHVNVRYMLFRARRRVRELLGEDHEPS